MLLTWLTRAPASGVICLSLTGAAVVEGVVASPVSLSLGSIIKGRVIVKVLCRLVIKAPLLMNTFAQDIAGDLGTLLYIITIIY